MLKPLISEKSLKLAQGYRYTFAVKPGSTKPQIKAAVEAAFGVKVLWVHTAAMPKRGKKAIVGLAPDQKIELWPSHS